jgi:hypothetical protein
MRRYLLAILGVATLVLLAGPAGAMGDLTIPIDTVVKADTGSVTELSSMDTPGDMVGATCVLEAVGQNQESQHPGNDLVVRSGSSETRLAGVEDAPGKTTPVSDEMVLGDTITVSLVMGGDEIFSGGVTLSFTCTAPATTTIAPPVTQPTVDTTVPPTTVPTSVLTSEITAPPTTTPAVTAPTAKVRVRGQTQTAAQPQAQALAATGSRSWDMALGAMALIGMGVAVKRWSASIDS